MDPDKLKAAIEAIKTGDKDAALALLEDMVLAAAGADDGDAGDPEALADHPPDEEPTELVDAPDGSAHEDDEDKDKELSVLARATGYKSVPEFLGGYKKLLSRVSTLDAASAEVELGARRELVAELVQLGVDTPATAWQGNAEKRNPAKRLMSEPIAELRARVESLRATRPAPLQAPSVRNSSSDRPLTKKELSACKKLGITPEELIERKASAVRRSN